MPQLATRTSHGTPRNHFRRDRGAGPSSNGTPHSRAARPGPGFALAAGAGARCARGHRGPWVRGGQAGRGAPCGTPGSYRRPRGTRSAGVAAKAFRPRGRRRIAQPERIAAARGRRCNRRRGMHAQAQGRPGSPAAAGEGDRPGAAIAPRAPAPQTAPARALHWIAARADSAQPSQPEFQSRPDVQRKQRKEREREPQVQA